jgi:hypothetical protein
MSKEENGRHSLLWTDRSDPVEKERLEAERVHLLGWLKRIQALYRGMPSLDAVMLEWSREINESYSDSDIRSALTRRQILLKVDRAIAIVERGELYCEETLEFKPCIRG